mmetsp:Transcript_35624/g.81652  ORF Transcript_35624/g.81652 Transcript_35624/m.81652 type:complete len:842 (+) Transcript_35624:44-2569(+)
MAILSISLTLLAWLACGLSLVSGTAQPLSASLSQAFNAGLMRVIQNGKWAQIVATWNKPFAASWTCSPDPTKYLFPEYASLDASHTLKEVLDGGVLKIAGFSVDWAADGNYLLDTPTGFWPDIVNAIVDEMRTAYGSHMSNSLTVERVYFQTSTSILNALQQGKEAPSALQIHMTEPYMFVSSLYTDPDSNQVYFRHERFHMSCAIGSATHMGFTAATSAADTQQGLNSYIAAQEPTEVPVGVLTKGNWDQYRPILDSNSLGVYVSEFSVSKSDAQELLTNLDGNLEAVRDFQVGSTNILMNWTLTHVQQGTADATGVSTMSALSAALLGYSTSEPVVLTFDHFADTDHLVEAVLRGDVYAGIVSALPALSQDSRLHVFDMSALSPQGALFRQDEPEDICAEQTFVRTNCSGGSSHLAENPLSSSLSRAVDAALVRIAANGDWERIVRSNSKWLAASWTCTPDTEFYTFPDLANLTDDDVLKQVLDRGELRVGGFEADWGRDGNYQLDDPTGFWPDMMNAIMAQLRTHYGKDETTLTLRRVFLNSSPLILEALRSGLSASEDQQIDMTEPYMLVSSFYTDPADSREYFRHERFQMSCTIGSAENAGFTRSDSGIYTQANLNTWIDERGAAGTPTMIGTLTKGNYDSYRPVLSEHAQGSYLTEVTVASASDMTTLLQGVDDMLEVQSNFTFDSATIMTGWTVTSYRVGTADAVSVSSKSDIGDLDYSAGVVVVFDHYVDTDHLVAAVIRGDVPVGMAALTQAIFENVELNAFKLSLLSPQAALFRLDGPMDVCPLVGFVPVAEKHNCLDDATDDISGATSFCAGGQLFALSAAVAAAKVPHY